MLFTQFALSAVFYLTFSLFFILGWPIIYRILPRPTLAYFLSKPAGLILFGYLVWFLGSFKILDYQNYWLIAGLFILLAIIATYFSLNFYSLNFKKSFKKILTIEALSFIVYLLYLWLRSHNSAINGTERFMDMAMLSAAGKTHFFPFIDPWYAGKAVNYYYYGAYLASLISNLARLPYALSYNFTLGLVYSQSSLLAASLVYLLSRSKKAALIGAFLATTAGTLFYAGCVLNGSMANPEQTCSYASSTRLYTPSYIINEIPSYSFTVGDLHAHLLALPFFIFNLILLYALFATKKINSYLYVLLAISLATSAMINSWDFITLIVLLCAIIAAKIFVIYKEKNEIKPQVQNLTIGLLSLVFGAIILILPFYTRYQSPVLGLGFTPSYVASHNLQDVQWPTPLGAELGMWGLFFAGLLLIFWKKRKQWQEYLFPATLAFVSLGIILGVELFFIQDIYSVSNPPYFRANTTFKFGYHAWVMLSIAFASLLVFIKKEKHNRKLAAWAKSFLVILFVAAIAGLYYPYQAIYQFYLTPNSPPLSLNGSDWMLAESPADLQTVNYINQNIKDRAVIAEAVGDSYSTFSRITTYTGSITPIGWTTHEWTWRFDGKAAKNAPYGQTVETGWGPIALIMGEIKQLYTTPDLSLAKSFIQKYGIQYVYIGDKERQTYPDLQEDKFKQLGQIVFQSGNSKLYKIIN